MTPPFDQILDGLDSYIDEQMRAWPGPGLAVGILSGSEVVHRGYGVRDVSSNEPIDSATLFSIGSCTKGFTTMALGLLIDQGALDWDTPLRRYLPDFELWDRTATEQLTLRDLASHRSGLPRHDLMWYGSAASREELVHRLRHLQPSKPFRYVFQYQNMMYVTAGLLIERVTGMAWEDFIAERIFRPLNMIRTTTDMARVQAEPNSAKPHGRGTNGIQQIPYYELGAAGPAGGIYSTLNDMTTWLRLQLDAGQYNGQPFIDAAILKEMHSPQVIMPPVPEMVWRDYPEISINASGMGWGSMIYRGHFVARHMGSINGFVAQISFLPEHNAGVMVFSNMDGNLLPVVVAFNLLDRLLGLEPLPWSERFCDFKAKVERQLESAREDLAANRQTGHPPSRPLAEYAGEYVHPAYGTLQITHADTTLTATRDALKFTLTPYHYDTFELLQESAELPVLASFCLNERGEIDAIRVPFEPSVEPIVFKRSAQAPVQD